MQPEPINAAIIDSLANRHVESIRGVSGSHEMPVTFFEATTALGLRTFSDSKVDIAVVEVGIGGEFDATNIFTE